MYSNGNTRSADVCENLAIPKKIFLYQYFKQGRAMILFFVNVLSQRTCRLQSLDDWAALFAARTRLSEPLLHKFHGQTQFSDNLLAQITWRTAVSLQMYYAHCSYKYSYTAFQRQSMQYICNWTAFCTVWTAIRREKRALQNLMSAVHLPLDHVLY